MSVATTWAYAGYCAVARLVNISDGCILHNCGRVLTAYSRDVIRHKTSCLPELGFVVADLLLNVRFWPSFICSSAFLLLQIRMASYASRSPYLATRGEVMKDYGIEWDRRFTTTLGVANKRLYELRLQTSNATYEQDKPQIDLITKSFKVFEVEA